MSFFKNFLARRAASSSTVARDRLQILLAHERSSNKEGDSELIRKLHKEILEVLARHVSVDQDKVQIKLDRGQSCSTLEIDIEVPQEGLTIKASHPDTSDNTPSTKKKVSPKKMDGNKDSKAQA